MELNENGIEHQATVDKGLKMKIKRKQLAAGGGGSKALDSKTRTVNDETNKLAKNAGTCLDLMTDVGDSKPVEDDAGSAGSDGPAQKSQKRKRNNKNGKSREVDATERPSSESENRARGRDLCQYNNRNKDPVGCALERSSNRKRSIGSAQDSGIDSKDQAQYAEDKELLNRIGNKTVEYGCPSSASGSEKSDFTCIPEVAAADREKPESTHSSDPYEFILRLEDLQQIPAKKFKSEKVCSCFISRRYLLSIKSMCIV